MLAIVNASGLVMLKHSVSRQYGIREGRWYSVLSCVQFHLPFWMGRTLPNMFALFPSKYTVELDVISAPKNSHCPVNVALSLLVGSSRKDSRSARFAIGLITASVVIFRAELALFLAPLALQMLITRKMTFWCLLSTGFISALLAIG